MTERKENSGNLVQGVSTDEDCHFWEFAAAERDSARHAV